MFCVEAPSANRSVEGCLRESGVLMLLRARACLPINCKQISSTERLKLRDIHEVDHEESSWFSRSVFGDLTNQHRGATKISSFGSS